MCADTPYPPCTHIQDILQELAPYLAHEQGTMRASVLRLLCCYDQPLLLAAPESQTSMNPSTNNSGPKAPRCVCWYVCVSVCVRVVVCVCCVSCVQDARVVGGQCCYS